jgi:uncharacterized membrane protein YeaQ/YmgE (transglycosylase-associated protein family)
MSILWFILFGLIIGLLARALMPGQQKMGLAATALIGIVGSFAGGIIGNLIHGRNLLQLQRSGFVGSLIGALVVLWVVMRAQRGRLPRKPA